MDEEKHLLSESYTDSEVDSVEHLSVHESQRRTLPSSIFTCIASFLLVVSVAANIFQFLQHNTHATQFTTFPGLQNIQQQINTHHAEHGVKNSDFQGAPSNVTREAWTALLQPFYFNASASELSTAGVPSETAVQVKNGGYLANLGVYHELHCLNQMRNFLYLRTSSTLSASQIDYYHSHLDHCIEVLRLSSMCNADLSLYTFTWPKEENFTFLDAHSKTPRKCVDWTQIEEWSDKRKVELAPTVIMPDE